MSSASAQLDGGPSVLNWHQKNGTAPQDRIAAIIAILDRRRGRDCPDHLWNPEKRYIPEMRQAWLKFLALRTIIRGQVGSLAGGLPLKLQGIQFINLQGKVVQWQDATANYLRYLPPPLVPGEATTFLPRHEVVHCLGEFSALAERVANYIPGYQRFLVDTAGELERETDAKNALAKYRELAGRFGDFTIDYRMSVTGKKRGEFANYDMAKDIRSRVSELSTLQRRVGSYERALTLCWYERVPGRSLSSLEIDGNVRWFLLEHPEVTEDEAKQAFKLITMLAEQHGLKFSHPGQARGIETSLAEIISANAPIGAMSRAMLKAYVVGLPFALDLNYERKVLLRLTDEDVFDRALYEAIQAQSTKI